jgi:hypothetical protein
VTALKSPTDHETTMDSDTPTSDPQSRNETLHATAAVSKKTAAAWKERIGPKKSPMIQMTSCPWMGGLWGREGVHPGMRSWLGTFGFRRTTFSQLCNIGEGPRKVKKIL